MGNEIPITTKFNVNLNFTFLLFFLGTFIVNVCSIVIIIIKYHALNILIFYT
jgi:hypothetical protein